MKEVIEVKRDDLRELYQVLTNYPAISKEQVQNEMHKVFGEDTFKPKDIMERVKTFEDACRELGEEHPFVRSYNGYTNNIHENNKNDTDILAYLKLRIICAALNEGWEPQFTEDEWRYYPWFWLYTQKEINDMDEDEKTDRRLMSTGEHRLHRVQPVEKTSWRLVPLSVSCISHLVGERTVWEKLNLLKTPRSL